RNGLNSSWRCLDFATYAVPPLKFEANTRVTQASFGPPARAIASVASAQLAPPFVVTCTLPSSLPTQITPAVTGDSEIVVIVQNCIAAPGGLIFVASFVVRSGLIASQWSPRSRDRNRTWAPA